MNPRIRDKRKAQFEDSKRKPHFESKDNRKAHFEFKDKRKAQFDIQTLNPKIKEKYILS